MDEWVKLVTEKCQKIDKMEAQFNRWFRLQNILLTIYLIISGIHMITGLL